MNFIELAQENPSEVEGNQPTTEAFVIAPIQIAIVAIRHVI